MAKSYLRGHRIECINNEWIYSDTKEATLNKTRNCKKCGKPETKNGHDDCLGKLPGVKNACCGHGCEEGYVQFNNGVIIRFELKSIEK